MVDNAITETDTIDTQDVEDTSCTSSYVDIPDVNSEIPQMIIASNFEASIGLNGTYTKGDNLFEDRTYYAKTDGSTFLKCHRGSWIFVPYLRSLEGIAQTSDNDGLHAPSQESVWSNKDGKLEGSISFDIGGMTIPEPSPQTAFLEDHWEFKNDSQHVAPDALVISGCIGHSEKLNGTYELSSDKKNDRVVYEKAADTDANVFIRWSNGSWVFSSVLDDELDSDEASYEEVHTKAFAIVTEDVSCPTLVKSDWRILESFFGQYVPYPAMNIKDVIRDIQPSLVRTSSLTSVKSVTFDPVEDVLIIDDDLDDDEVEILGHLQVRGWYTKMKRSVFGRVAYQKQMDGRTLYLRYHPSGAWVISDTLEDALEDEINDRALDYGAPSGCAVVSDDAQHPGEIKATWQIFETYFGNYIDCEAMKVKCAAFPEKEEEVEAKQKQDVEKELTPEEIFNNAPEPIVVEGFNGTNSNLNGTYWKGSAMHENRVYYENNQHDIYIRYQRQQSCWIFSEELSKKMIPLAVAKSDTYDVMSIGDIWEAPEAFFSKFAPCNTVKISCHKHKPRKRSRSKENSEERQRPRKVNRYMVHGDLSSGFELKVVIGAVPVVTNPNCVEVVADKNGQELAGVYLIANDEYNGKPFYKKKVGFITEEDEFTYICWHDSSQWIITTDITSLDAALAKTIDDTDYPGQVGSPWMVKTAGKFHAEDDFTVKHIQEADFSEAQDKNESSADDITYDDSEVLDPAEKEVMLSQAPNQIVVIGRQGQNDLINGTYNKGFCCHEDKVYYTHCDQSCVLRWHERSGAWVFSKCLSNDLEGFAACQSDAFFPSDIKGVWKFFGNELTEDDGIKITDAKIIRRAISKLSARKRIPEPFMSHELRKAYSNFSAPADYPDLADNKTVMAKVLTEDMYGQLRNRQTKGGCTLDKAIQTGLDNPDQTGSGVLLGDRDSFLAFAPLVNGILDHTASRYPSDFEQETDWHLSDSESQCFDAAYVLSCRAHVDRNLSGYDMPVECSRGNRRQIKEYLVRACAMIGGGFLQEMDEMDEDMIIQKRFAFDMNEPVFSCRRDYPEGRAIYLGRGDAFSVWINETQHCSVVVNERSGDVKKTFMDAYNLVDKIQEQLAKIKANFAYDNHLGFLNSDPAKCGTALKMSARCYLPLLSVHDCFPELLRNLRLKSTPMGDGKIEVSNLDCVGISEKFILERMLEGIETLVDFEKTLETKLNIDDKMQPKVRLPWSESSTKKFLRERIGSFMDFQRRLSTAGPAPDSIIIFGRSGMNNILNGLYLIGQEKFNGRPYWQKASFDRVPVYLRYHNSGMWILDEVLEDRYHGMAFIKSEAVYPHLASGSWRVFCDDKHFHVDDSMTITDHERGVRLDRDEIIGRRMRWKSVPINDAPHAPERPKIPLLRSLSIVDTFKIVRQESFHLAAPERILIEGEHPRALFTNGIYTKCEKTLHNDRPIWRKSDGSYSCFIRWHTKGLWIISDFLNDRLGGFALLHDPTATNPTLARRTWQIQAGGAGYIKHPNIKAVAVSDDHSDEQAVLEERTAKQTSVHE